MHLIIHQFKTPKDITIIVLYRQYSFLFTYIFALSCVLHSLLNSYASLWRTPLTISFNIGLVGKKFPPILFVWKFSYFMLIFQIYFHRVLTSAVFSFCMLKMLFHCLLTSLASVDKSYVGLTDVPVKVMSFSCWIKIFSTY